MTEAAPYLVTSLDLHGFRNYPALSMQINAGPVVLTGANGAGKTNILEALSLLIPGKGLRGDTLDAMCHEDTPLAGWTVSVGFNHRDRSHRLGTSIGQRADRDEKVKRLIRHDQENVRSHTELSKLFAVSWLTPQMEQVLLHHPGDRRKFVDRMVAGFDHDHASRLQRYEKAMRERNRLLQQSPLSADWDTSWLDVLEQTLAEEGVAIAIARAQTLAQIMQAMTQTVSAFPQANAMMAGEVDQQLQTMPALQTELWLREQLSLARERDALIGQTRLGVHRSDLVVTMKSTGVSLVRCSTGEQKALLVALLLAEVRALAHWRQIVPLLLLDEIAVHFDRQRRQVLCEEIMALGAQVWFTGTDADLYADLRPHAQFFTVTNGQIVAE
jgi:DNA replication and repair protein RecF